MAIMDGRAERNSPLETPTMTHLALARTIPARRRAASFGQVVRLPEPIFTRIALTVPIPPVMLTRTADGIIHASPAIALEWQHTIDQLRSL